MKLSRRSALQLGSVVLGISVAGCNFVGSSSPNAPAIESRNVEVVRSECVGQGPREHRATASYDSAGHRLTFDGTLKTSVAYTELALADHTGNGRQEFQDDSVHISVDTISAEDYTSCPTEIDYSASAEFEYDPSTVYIYHVEKRNDDWTKVGPITSTEISQGFRLR